MVKIKKIPGVKWSISVDFWRNGKYVVGFEFRSNGPWLLVLYKIKEYNAERNNRIIIIGIIEAEKEIILVDNKISLGKLRNGGAAIFIITPRNQKREKIGAYSKIPLDKINLREEENS